MESIEKAFAEIGSRVRVEPLPQERRITSALRRQEANSLPRIRMNVLRDKKGEFFQIRADDSITMCVINRDKRSRHLLLFARDAENTKYRYLCGHDERGLFAAAVPVGVSSVINAMEALKPDAVLQSQSGLSALVRNKRKNSAFRRQGEWYFVPAPELDPNRRLILRNEPIRRGRGRAHIVENAYRRGGENVHVCRQYPNGLDEAQYRKMIQENPNAKNFGWTTLRRNMEVYGKGKVMHPDHKTVVLNGWHRILPNRETEATFIETVVFLD